MSDPQPIQVANAPLAAGDPTRRFAVDVAGTPFFPGLTRPEAEDVCAWVGDGNNPVRALVLVELGMFLSDGTGPHLLDASGALVLVLGPHSQVGGALVAMGALSPLHAMGAVGQLATGRYRWIVRRDVSEAARVVVLNALDACGDYKALLAWESDRGGDRK